MKYFKFIFLFITAATFVACDDDSTLGVSRVTTYPVLNVTGDASVLLELGTSFTDPGATAKAGETDITPTATTSKGLYYGQDFNTNTPDQYTITYAAENEDGFSGTALRSIWVAKTGDLTTSIEGLYTSDVQRAPSFTQTARYDDMKYVLIKKTGANTYEITDGMGGYYDLGRGFGFQYASRGAVITVNDIATNDFSISQAKFPIWGNTADLTEFKVDAANNMITFTANGNFGNGTFKVQLTQVQL